MFCLTQRLSLAALLLAGGCASYTPPDPETLSSSSMEASAAPPLPEDAGPRALIAYALEHHPELTAAQARLEAARAQESVAGALADPELTLGVSEMGQRVALQQRIPLFGKRRLAREQARYRAEAAAARQAELRLSLTRTLLERYADYAYILASEQILAEQLTLLNQLSEVVRVRYQSGQSGQSDWLRIENERDSLANERRNLEDSARAAAAQLNAALGRPAQAPLPALQPLAHQHQDFDETALQAALVRENPALQAQLSELVVGDLERELAQRSGQPDLMVGVEHQRDDMRGNSTGAMVGINLPIWRGRYRAEQEAAEAGYRALEAQYLNRQQQLEAELSTALFRWREAERNRQLYGEDLNRRAEQALYAARSAYRAGEGGFTELIDSQREWLAFQRNYQRALADGLKARAQISTLTGRPLPEQDRAGEGSTHE